MLRKCAAQLIISKHGRDWDCFEVPYLLIHSSVAERSFASPSRE